MVASWTRASYYHYSLVHFFRALLSTRTINSWLLLLLLNRDCWPSECVGSTPTGLLFVQLARVGFMLANVSGSDAFYWHTSQVEQSSMNERSIRVLHKLV